jgi:hypothetical protein
LVAADILVREEEVLVEHWDVIEGEARRAQSKSGNPMFRSSFPDRYIRDLDRPAFGGAVKV